MFRLLITYHVSVQGVDERGMKNVHHYHEGGREGESARAKQMWGRGCKTRDGVFSPAAVRGH